MIWFIENWQFIVEFLVNCVIAFILYLKTRDVKYLKNLCPKEENPPEISESELDSASEKKPEVYLSVTKLKEILSELEQEDK